MSDQMDIGFLGLGIMGEAMARNLINSGKFKSVTVWNRSESKCDALVSEGAKRGSSPAEVVKSCAITFAMLGDPAAALAVVEGPDGIAGAISGGKGYVDMSTVDDVTSKRISEQVQAQGGRCLEAPVAGSKQPAIAGQLVILAAGDESLYNECHAAFDVMGKRHFYLGPPGQGARMKLVINMIMGTMLSSFCEGLSLADKAGLKQEDLLEVLGLAAIANPMFALKGPSILKGEFPPAFPLKHQQKDLRLALELGNTVGQALPVAAAADQRYRQAVDMGQGDADFSAVYLATREPAGKQ